MEYEADKEEKNKYYGIYKTKDGFIAIAMTPIGIWRLRKMDLVEKVKDLSQ